MKTTLSMMTLSHLLNTPIVSYSEQFGNWQRYSPHNVDRTLRDETNQMSMYLSLHCSVFSEKKVVCE